MFADFRAHTGRAETKNPGMKVTAIIVTYNGMHWIDRCLGSVRGSALPVRAIVVDNGSSDGTAEHIARHFPEVEFIRAERNLGFGQANNRGMRIALDRGGLGGHGHREALLPLAQRTRPCKHPLKQVQVNIETPNIDKGGLENDPSPPIFGCPVDSLMLSCSRVSAPMPLRLSLMVPVRSYRKRDPVVVILAEVRMDRLGTSTARIAGASLQSSLQWRSTEPRYRCWDDAPAHWRSARSTPGRRLPPMWCRRVLPPVRSSVAS
jgi:hypothetical protein